MTLVIVYAYSAMSQGFKSVVIVACPNVNWIEFPDVAFV